MRRSASENRPGRLTPQAIRITRPPTLYPLVGAPASRILELRVVDPAMGSGAFLVAACHYLARAYEAALVRERGCHHGDIGEAERASFGARGRAVSLRRRPQSDGRAACSLVAVAGHASADSPLTFLDHRLQYATACWARGSTPLRGQFTVVGHSSCRCRKDLFGRRRRAKGRCESVRFVFRWSRRQTRRSSSQRKGTGARIDAPATDSPVFTLETNRRRLVRDLAVDHTTRSYPPRGLIMR